MLNKTGTIKNPSAAGRALQETERSCTYRMLRKVLTENGWVEGIPAADPRITAFKGIPFAAPPVGDLRWRAPQPAKNWEGVRKAYTFAPISM